MPEVSLSTMKTSVETPSSTTLNAGLTWPDRVSERPLWSRQVKPSATICASGAVVLVGRGNRGGDRGRSRRRRDRNRRRGAGRARGRGGGPLGLHGVEFGAHRVELGLLGFDDRHQPVDVGRARLLRHGGARRGLPPEKWSSLK